MGKIVKYCTSCDEGFSEKFSFCPNCAKELAVFEMKAPGNVKENARQDEERERIESAPETTRLTPIAETPVVEAFDSVIEVPEEAPVRGQVLSDDFVELDIEDEPIEEALRVESSEEVLDVGIGELKDDSEIEIQELDVLDVLETEETVPVVASSSVSDSLDIETDDDDEVETIVRKRAATTPVAKETDGDSSNVDDDEEVDIGGAGGMGILAAASSPGAKRFVVQLDKDEDKQFEKRAINKRVHLAPVDKDDSYSVTTVPEKGRGTRMGILLGSGALVLTSLFGFLLYSIFTNPFFVASIGDEGFLPPPVEITPEKIEEEPPEIKKDGKEGGGGGGGGTERDKPASKGELPSQTRDPIPPPMPVERMTNPSLAIVNQTQGDIKRKRTQRAGLPDGVAGRLSGGSGSGGGFGSGTGTGFGSGRGTGEGSGIGSGSGSGIGDGTGSGRGSGTGREARRSPPPKPKPKPVGVTAGVNITSRPRAPYTDAARQKSIQGTVILRVTFQANGRIGNISTVKSLPYGLTQQAIAAARRMRFKPATRNGQPYSVSKQVQYSFTLY